MGEKKKKDAPASSGGKPAQPPAPGFDCRLRFERKGRGGQPVFVLYAFNHASQAKWPEASLEGLARALKQSLSCGGSFGTATPGGFEIVLQFRDEERLTKTLLKWDLKAQRSGG